TVSGSSRTSRRAAARNAASSPSLPGFASSRTINPVVTIMGTPFVAKSLPATLAAVSLRALSGSSVAGAAPAMLVAIVDEPGDARVAVLAPVLDESEDADPAVDLERVQ